MTLPITTWLDVAMTIPIKRIRRSARAIPPVQTSVRLVPVPQIKNRKS